MMKKILLKFSRYFYSLPRTAVRPYCLFQQETLRVSMLLILLIAGITTTQAQIITISGTVKDANNSALSGVTVAVKGTGTGTLTNNRGQYTIDLPSPSSVLVFTFVGFNRQEIAVSGRSVVSIVMSIDSKNLNEVVVVGYGTQNKRDVTGAVSTIRASDLNTTNAVSVDNLIQGKAAGVTVNSYTSQPGGDVSVIIRGSLSPNGSNAPLYVIDGLPLTTQSYESVPTPGSFRGNIDRSPLNSINPNDIASIDILKDASATAIYGSAAANGVVLITTKKGREGVTTVNYSGTYSIQNLKKYLQPLDATQFENAVNNYGNEYYKTNNKLAPYGTTDPSSIAPYKPFFTPVQIGNAGKGTNYINYALRNGYVNDQNISISGGTANTKVFTSFNYFKQQGLIRNSDFARYAGRVNLDQKIGKAVTFSLGLTYSQVNNNNVPVGNSSDLDSPSLLQTALQFPSSIPLLDANGMPSKAYYSRTPNPQSYLKITNQTFTKRIIVTPNLQINIINGLKLNMTGGVDNNSSDNQFFIPVAAGFNTVPSGDAQRSLNKNNNYSAEGYLTYDKKFGKSHFAAVAGVGYYQSNNNYFGLDAVGFSTDVFGVNNIGIADQKLLSSVYSGKTERTKLSQFTRLNYTYNDKYIFQFTGRFDGTSNFPQTHQFGFFPGISGGWLINREDFLKDVKWVTQLKLRGGYGTSGNESITAYNNYVYSLYALTNNYSYLFGNHFYNSGFTQTQLGNPDLKWETDAQLDAAIDFGFFDNRISGSLDYFQRTATNLLDFRILPSQNAITRQAFNVGSTRSKGLELTLNTQNIVTPDFTWSTTLTFGTSRVYWLKRNPAVSLAPYIGNHDALHEVYGWKTSGIIQSASDVPVYQKGGLPGNVKYVDANNDGKLDINDVRSLGNTDPKGSFGLNNTLKYKGLDLSFFFYGSYGYLAYDGWEQFSQIGKLIRPGVPSNADVHSLQTWASFNVGGKYPGLAPDVASSNNPTGTSDYLSVKNGYFARLKDINLGYTLPESLFKGGHFIKSLRVFVDVQNLFFISNTTGIDPEMSRDNNPYPTAVTTAFGLNARF